MHIVEALDQMDDVLVSRDVDAPLHQLMRVRAWRGEIAFAAGYGSAFRNASGMFIASAPFLFGRTTHLAWKGLCAEIIAALRSQQRHAARILHSLPKAASTPQEHAIIRAQAVHATAWLQASARAELSGVILVADMDSLYRPVGKAIAAAGGINEVAQYKHYHQRLP